MNDRLEFAVTGLPIPEGSMRAVPTKRGARVIFDNERDLKRWRKRVTAVAKGHMQFRRPWPAQVPVALHLVFEMPRPASVKRPRPSVRPDLSKLIRAVEDSLTDAGVWRDDGQVVSIRADQYYSATPGVRVLVRDADLAAPMRRADKEKEGTP